MKGWTFEKGAYKNYNLRLWSNDRTGKILEVRFIPLEEFKGYKYLVLFPGTKTKKCRILSDAIKVANKYMKMNK